MIVVIVKQHLVQIGRIHGATEYKSSILAAIRSIRNRPTSERAVWGDRSNTTCYEPFDQHFSSYGVQGYLAQKKPPTLLGQPQGPRHRPAVGS
jgi:hypothetical protein